MALSGPGGVPRILELSLGTPGLIPLLFEDDVTGCPVPVDEEDVPEDPDELDDDEELLVDVTGTVDRTSDPPIDESVGAADVSIAHRRSAAFSAASM